MDIRPFVPTDETAAVALWRVCELLRPWNDPARDVARKLAHQPELFLVGTHQGGLIATLMAGYDGHRGWLYYLGVAPAHRGRGHARALVAHAEDLLTAMGCPKSQVMVRADNAATSAFYARLGYLPSDVTVLGNRLIQDH